MRLTRFTRVALDSSGYEDAIALGLIRADDSELDVLAFSDLVDDRLDSVDSPLAVGYTAAITADFAVGVRQQLASLTSNLLTGLLAVAQHDHLVRTHLDPRLVGRRCDRHL